MTGKVEIQCGQQNGVRRLLELLSKGCMCLLEQNKFSRLFQYRQTYKTANLIGKKTKKEIV